MISFIVPAHDEAALIGSTLGALRRAARAAGEPYEIVVVADACTDRTAEIAAAPGASVVAIESRQISAARNAGANHSRGDVLFFLDADTWATPAAVLAGLRAVQRGAAGGGCAFRFDGAIPLWARFLHPLGIAVGRRLRLVGGCFVFCTRSAFDRVGGFSEEFFCAEELVFIAALKRVGRFVVPRPSVVTSGRKLRTLPARDLLGLLGDFLTGGLRSFRGRQRMAIWYGERRPDPGAPRAVVGQLSSP